MSLNITLFSRRNQKKRRRKIIVVIFLGSWLPKAVGCLGGAVYVLMELAGGNGSQDTTAALDRER